MSVRVSVLRTLLVQPLPHPGLVPLLKTPPAGHVAPAAYLLRKHLPRYATLKDEQYPRERRPVVDAGPAALGLRWLLGQERLDNLPQLVSYQCFSHAPTLPATQFC